MVKYPEVLVKEDLRHEIHYMNLSWKAVSLSQNRMKGKERVVKLPNLTNFNTSLS
jgi:hypothetical protein